MVRSRSRAAAARHLPIIENGQLVCPAEFHVGEDAA
jgi:hypothetical protein